MDKQKAVEVLRELHKRLAFMPQDTRLSEILQEGQDKALSFAIQELQNKPVTVEEVRGFLINEDYQSPPDEDAWDYGTRLALALHKEFSIMKKPGIDTYSKLPGGSIRRKGEK